MEVRIFLVVQLKFFDILMPNRTLAQLVERLFYMQDVVGSNPTGTTNWPIRLSVRSSGFHPGKSGSIPGGTTKM